MKYVVLLACLFFPGMAPAQGHPCPDALFRYWEFKDRLHKHFVRLDWWGDGIGKWDNDRKRYEKAGYGVPAAQLYVIPKSCLHDGYHANCSYPTELLTNCDQSNVLTWGADSPAYLGHYMAVLATEYALLRRNNQTEAMSKTLWELWLALQAYRRLDMTANRHYQIWLAENNPACPFDQNSNVCGLPFDTPRFDGYSGFFLRNDTPYKTRHFFNENNGGQKAWEVGGITSSYGCGEADPIGYFLPDKDNRSGDNILSQDQMIGILFGLAFIKKYVPDDANVFGTNILDMAKNIATGMLGHIKVSDKNFEPYRSIRYPACLNDIKVKVGGDCSSFFLGINKAVAYVNPQAPVCLDGVDGQKWRAIGTKACDCGIPFYENCGFNCRMLLELMAVSDDGNFNKIQDKAARLGKEAYIAARYLLHEGEYDITQIKPIVKRSMENALFHDPPSCHGICYRPANANGPYFECPNVYGWCATNRLLAGNIDRVWCNYNTNTPRRGNGLDYMLMHNLYLLAFAADAPFFNPDVPEDGTCFRLPNIFLGEKSICPPGTTELSLPPGMDDFDEIYWGASQNLSLHFTDISKKSIEVSVKNVQDTDGWVRVMFVRNGCERTYSWSKIRIGPPPLPVLQDRSGPCRYDVCLENEHADIFNIVWEVNNIERASYAFLKEGACASLALFTPPPYQVNMSVMLSNTCGDSIADKTFSFDCDDRLPKYIRTYPNPASDMLHLEFQNLSHHILHERSALVRIYDPFSRIVHTEPVGANASTIDISGLENGLYFVHAVAGGHTFSARFVKQD